MEKRKLAIQTLFYGFGNIFGRLSYFLVIPLQARKLGNADLGLISEIYLYISILNVICLFGMETAFFKFNKEKNLHNTDINHNDAFGSAITIILLIYCLVSLIIGFNANKIAHLMGHDNITKYIYCVLFILFFDSISEIPLAYLRLKEKVRRVVCVQFIKVGMCILSNTFVLYFLDSIYHKQFFESLYIYVHRIYDPNNKLYYLLISNILSSLMVFLFTLPYSIQACKSQKSIINIKLIKKMLFFSLPMVIVGIMGISNEMIIRVSVKYFYGNEALLGVFASYFKLALFLSLFIRSYRYAIEPFVVSRIKNKVEDKAVLASLLDIFVITTCIIIFTISMNIDILSRIFLGPRFTVGVGIVPYIMLCYLLSGIYYNVSFWLKITKKTYFSILFSISALSVSVSTIYFLTPIIGCWGNVAALLLGNTTALLLCYALGRYHFPVPYKIKKSFLYIAFTMVLVFILRKFIPHSLPLKIVYGNTFVVLYIIFILFKEREHINELRK